MGFSLVSDFPFVTLCILDGLFLAEDLLKSHSSFWLSIWIVEWLNVSLLLALSNLGGLLLDNVLGFGGGDLWLIVELALVFVLEGFFIWIRLVIVGRSLGRSIVF